MISRNLAICLGVTGVTSVLLFLYFRHRVSTVEEKMEAIFQLIQQEARDSMNDRIQFTEKKGFQEEQEKKPEQILKKVEEKAINLEQQKIEVSESESESESESDSESEIDSDEEHEQLKISEIHPEVVEVLNDKIETIELQHDVKEEVKEELSDKSNEDKKDDDEDSLDEVNLDDLDEVPELKKETKSLSLPIVNYEEMRVSDLKTLASTKGLSGYSHLKKKDLVQLLQENS